MFHGKNHVVAFFLYPVLFAALSFLLLFAALAPTIRSVSAAADLLFFSSEARSEKQMGNIFTQAPKVSVDTVKLSSITFPQYGTRFGRITIPSASIQADLFFGDGAEALRKGVGVYNGSFIPGYGKTILIAGHNHTYFHRLGQAKTGDFISIETNYGVYRYRITNALVKSASDQTAYDLKDGEENLILYTCYPFDCIGLTPQRYYVYAKYVSGPKIDKQG
ncbi:MAG TPA: class D sortase [Caproiciproducens sp.]|nr:class D sortase [Caproiciproducens sp.]